MRTLQSIAALFLLVAVLFGLVLVISFHHFALDAISAPFMLDAISAPFIPPRVAQWPVREVSFDPSLSTLIVGGTDGSGTRSVVQLLDKLGVPIVADVLETFDCGGKEMDGHGWPPTVRSVMNAARRVDYDVEDLPKGVLESAVRNVHRFWSRWRAMPGIQEGEIMGKSNISWGFKAPVSMLLLPIFMEVSKRKNYGQIKFVHVVRDGRDIAYSGNQSPVKKFYNVSFSERKKDLKVPLSSLTEDEKHIRAIELWSSWNTQLYALEQRTAQRMPDAFQFHILHIEDLVSTTFETRLAAISALAHFVGAKTNNDGICCLANDKKKDLGSHTKMDVVRDSVESRYGKWKSMASKAMVSKMNEIGKDGLIDFGYPPYERKAIQIDTMPNNITCSVDICDDWTAPVSLLTRMSRRQRMQNYRSKGPPGRIIPKGIAAVLGEPNNPHDELIRRRRENIARMSQNKFRTTMA